MADEVAARLQTHVLVVLGTDLAHLEGGAHLAVDLVLLLGHLNVLLLRGGQDLRQVHVLVQTTWIQVAGGGGGEQEEQEGEEEEEG